MFPLYLLTPWCRVLLEKLTGLQPVKKFPAFHGTRRFITALTSVRQLTLSWASPIQSIYPHPTSWRSILLLSTHLRLDLPSGSLRAFPLTYTNSNNCSVLYLYSFSDKLYPTCWWPQQQWPKHVVDNLYTPDNIVVLWRLYPYRIITLGSRAEVKNT